MIDGKLKFMFALPFLLIALSFVAVDLIPFRSALTFEEQQVIGFVPEDLKMPAISRAAPEIDITQPLELAAHRDDTPRQPVEQTEALPRRKVYMIVTGSRGGMAVIDGLLVREGDSIGTLIVKKIEPRRVLVQSVTRGGGQPPESGQQWLSVEDTP